MYAMLAVIALAGCSEDELAHDGYPVETTIGDAPFQWTRAEDVETRSKLHWHIRPSACQRRGASL